MGGGSNFVFPSAGFIRYAAAVGQIEEAMDSVGASAVTLVCICSSA
jgi:hypothetical protein